MKLGNFQRRVKEESSYKEEQNELAMVLAQRDDDCILYEDEHPLVISNDCKIVKLEIKDEEYDRENEKDVMIEFEESEEKTALDSYKSEKTPFTMSIHTFLSLDDFEQELIKCNELSEIEDLEDSH